MSHLKDNRRHNIITASNAWAAVYERQKLWRQMTFREPPFEGNEMTQWGIDNEPLALSAFEKEMDEICLPGNKLMVHDTLPFGASPDAYLDNGAVVELKCPYSQEYYDVMPPRYYFQIQMQMLVCNKNMAWFGVWTPNGIRIQNITYNKKWEDWYIPLALEFMQYVNDDVEPKRWTRKPIFNIEE